MEELYYPCNEKNGADQLRGYREADLRLCFRICILLVFSCGSSIDVWTSLYLVFPGGNTAYGKAQCSIY